MKITEKTWPLFASAIARGDPLEYNEAALERLMDVMDPWITRVSGVHTQFRANNYTLLIDFQTPQEREEYNLSWEKYMAKKAKIEGRSDLSAAQSRFLILAQFTVWRRTAEGIRSPYLGDAMFESVRTGHAAACAVNFRGTICKAVEHLIKNKGVSRDQISLIWGGSQVKQTKKGELKKQFVEHPELLELMQQEGIDLDALELGDDVEVKEEKSYPPEWRMGAQDKKQRQAEIDAFQKGKTLYCFFTFKAGGVGLSLHHTDEWFKNDKNIYCRRKPSGFVFEEDIIRVPTRPRECFLAPTWSAIELVQGLGRCPRLTSLSNTSQTLVFYRNTIEERVKAVTDAKLRCLSKVTRLPKTEQAWEDIATSRQREEAEKRHIESVAKLQPSEDDNNGLLGNIESDEDEE